MICWRTGRTSRGCRNPASKRAGLTGASPPPAGRAWRTPRVTGTAGSQMVGRLLPEEPVQVAAVSTVPALAPALVGVVGGRPVERVVEDQPACCRLRTFRTRTAAHAPRLRGRSYRDVGAARAARAGPPERAGRCGWQGSGRTTDAARRHSVSGGSQVVGRAMRAAWRRSAGDGRPPGEPGRTYRRERGRAGGGEPDRGGSRGAGPDGGGRGRAGPASDEEDVPQVRAGRVTGSPGHRVAVRRAKTTTLPW